MKALGSYIVALVLPLAGCLEALAPEVGPLQTQSDACNQDIDPANTVSFAADVSPIFRSECDRCHRSGGDGQQDSGLELTTYTSLLAGGSRSVGTIVVAGKPCASALYQKISSAPPFGSRMPRESAPLTTAEIETIHDWISEGGLDN